MNKISVVILTYNKELNLEYCLQNIKKLTTDIFIVDSFSNDNTLDIAKKYNCQVFQNKFVNHANQLNWAIENVPFSSKWILRVDADEFLTDLLIDEIKHKLPSIPEDARIFFKRRVYFMNKWIRFGGYYPTKLLRAWRVGKAVCEQRWMDEHMKLLEGKAVQFQHDMVDENAKNLHWWIEKHNDYATREAIEHPNTCKYNLLSSSNYVQGRLFITQEQSKRWLKEKGYALIPLGVRPFIYFLYRYIL